MFEHWFRKDSYNKEKLKNRVKLVYDEEKDNFLYVYSKSKEKGIKELYEDFISVNKNISKLKDYILVGYPSYNFECDDYIFFTTNNSIRRICKWSNYCDYYDLSFDEIVNEVINN